MSRSLVSALGALAILSTAAIALAGQPDPGQSSGENRIGVSPKNLTAPASFVYTYTFTLRDNTGAPVVNFPASQVELDFDDCFEPSTRPADEIQADGPSDLNGDVVWSTNLNFGGSDPCAVDVLVQNLVFATIPGDSPGGVRSPDVNGDGQVSLADLSLFQGAFVSGGPPYVGDLLLDDDTPALGDLSLYQNHFTAP